MSAASLIEWTQTTWNPVTGCDRISAGCDHCYALRLARRLKAMGQPRYQHDGHPVTSGPGFGVTVHPDALDEPLRWRTPRLVFVNSMSDLFHARVPAAFLAEVFAVMLLASRHTFQVLTKRPGRMRTLLGSDPGSDQEWPEFRWEVYAEATARTTLPTAPASYTDAWPLPNVWLGTSVEHAATAHRVATLREVPAALRFLSCEPLLGPLGELDLTGIGWVIIGGESGPGARPMALGWAREVVEQCRAAGVPVFVKQLGTVTGRQLGCTDGKGGDLAAWPAELRIRQFPTIPPRGWTR